MTHSKLGDITHFFRSKFKKSNSVQVEIKKVDLLTCKAKLSGNQFINLESESDTKVRILGTQKDLTIDLENPAALEALIFEFQSIVKE